MSIQAQQAAERLLDAGYLYLGIHDAPKPIEGAVEIIDSCFKEQQFNGELGNETKRQFTNQDH